MNGCYVHTLDNFMTMKSHNVVILNYMYITHIYT